MVAHFKRPNVAKSLAAQVMGGGLVGASTLFFGAPRRTGKSTFLTQELTPALESNGAFVAYVDLWKNRQTDPGELIAITIASALAQEQGAVARAAQKVGLTKISIRGVEFTLAAVGKVAGASLSDALEALINQVKRPVVLIVDEAQHAITTDAGMNAMFALKSARDTLNQPGNVRLGLVMSGSDRDKLLRLVHGNHTPFLGSKINELPFLGKDYTNFLAGRIAVEKPSMLINNDKLYEAFERFDHRPEEISSAINSIAGPLGSVTDTNFHELLEEETQTYIDGRAEGYVTTYQSLTPLQKAVLTRILSHGKPGKIFTGEALASYSQAIGSEVQAGSARSAVNSLRESDPPLIWKSSRGDYTAEDSGMRSWYERLVAANSWPPQD